ncbi:ubiquitin-like-conjugating enzyme ATG10 [Macrobrachium nipponense]|uniref:ubiquitin-like-conjugating enzyme ATG10 n=1 Tax=Macrobrachium nipponense TaxID=159736 RepID=UPI0030C83F42
MCYLTYKEFVDACLELIGRSQEIGDNWKANGNVDVEGNFFISKKRCIPEIHETQNSTTDIMDGSNSKLISSQNDYFEPDDPSCFYEYQQCDSITYDYHVVYSISHSVPVLYFNAWYMTGNSLKLEDIWSRIPTQFKEQVMLRKWESLTQHDHPVLGVPYFQLHPCNTMKLMSQLKFENEPSLELKGKKYILSWLSMFGPIVGLELSNQYFTT